MRLLSTIGSKWLMLYTHHTWILSVPEAHWSVCTRSITRLCQKLDESGSASFPSLYLAMGAIVELVNNYSSSVSSLRAVFAVVLGLPGSWNCWLIIADPPEEWRASSVLHLLLAQLALPDLLKLVLSTPHGGLESQVLGIHVACVITSVYNLICCLSFFIECCFERNRNLSSEQRVGLSDAGTNGTDWKNCSCSPSQAQLPFWFLSTLVAGSGPFLPYATAESLVMYDT